MLTYCEAMVTDRGPHGLLVPVLVDGAWMPTASNLPGTLLALERINAVSVDASRFETDLARLERAILSGR